MRPSSQRPFIPMKTKNTRSVSNASFHFGPKPSRGGPSKGHAHAKRGGKTSGVKSDERKQKKKETPPERSDISCLRIGPSAKGDWTKIFHCIFSHLVFENSDKNVWVCVPQLMSLLLFLALIAGTEISDLIKSLLIGDNVKGEQLSKIQSCMNTMCDELRAWEKNLRERAKPGFYTNAQRMIVHKKYSKSYTYATFAAMNVLNVETAITDDTHDYSELLRWVQRQLRVNNVTTVPFEMWRHHVPHFTGTPNESSVTWEDEEEVGLTTKRDHLHLANLKCPILAWISHYQLAFETGVMDSSVYQKPGAEPRYMCFQSHKTDSHRALKYYKMENVEVYSVPATHEYVTVCFVPGSTTAESILKVVECICSNESKMEVRSEELKKIYVPIFPQLDPVTNIGKAIMTGLQVPALFNDRIGDIGQDNAVASAEMNHRVTASMQMFDIITLMHISEGTATLPLPLDAKIIAYPYTVVIYDCDARLPIYFGRIVDQAQRIRLDTARAEKPKCTII